MSFYLSFLSLIIWLYLLFLYSRQGPKLEHLFWTNKIVFEKIFNKKEKKKLANANLCIVIPARNESQNIISTLNSLLKQNIKHKYILIVDDNSTDRTAEISELFLKKNNFKKFKVLKGRKLPLGWSGKVWALKQAIDFIGKKKFSHLLFLDSDITMEKNIISDTLEFLEKKKTNNGFLNG